MTALKGNQVAAFLKNRDRAITAVLIHGTDSTIVREHARTLAGQVVDNLDDPFNVVTLTDADLKEEPGRLADEASALSMMGGERVIFLRGQDASITKSAKLLIDGLDNETIKSNALVLIEADALKKTSGLRKVFEASKHAAAIAVYDDKPADLQELITQALAAENLTIADNALMTFIQAVGGDRGLMRSELEKLILYMGPPDNRPDDRITLTHIQDCIVDSVDDTTFEIAGHVAEGRADALAEALHRAAGAGTNVVTILVFLQRHFGRLYAAQSLIDGGMAASAAMKKLKPPVFYAEEANFQRQLKNWRTAKLEAAIAMLLDTDFAAKTTGLPQQEIVERTALRLCRMATR